VAGSPFGRRARWHAPSRRVTRHRSCGRYCASASRRFLAEVQLRSYPAGWSCARRRGVPPAVRGRLATQCRLRWPSLAWRSGARGGRAVPASAPPRRGSAAHRTRPEFRGCALQFGDGTVPLAGLGERATRKCAPLRCLHRSLNFLSARGGCRCERGGAAARSPSRAERSMWCARAAAGRRARPS
jgi:hypothetical protein